MGVTLTTGCLNKGSRDQKSADVLFAMFAFAFALVSYLYVRGKLSE